MAMDPMALLDMERRTGISSKDVDEFANRMDLVSEAMEQIKNGTFDPEKCTIPGYKSPAQEAREADMRAQRDAERRREADEKQRQDKADERAQWWKRAKLRFAIERGDDDGAEHQEEGENETQTLHDPASEATQWASRILAAYKSRDANDYSIWNNWVPEDPATLEEKAARDAALEKVRNAEFEKNNPDFCQQFRDDLTKRQLTQREREREAEKFKLLGNRYYRRRDYEPAIVQYMKALEKAPFNVAVLTNLAQCFLRLEALDDSVEFSTRALYVDPRHVKALSRRAAVWHRQQKWEVAARDMEKARMLEPENEDVVEQHSIVVGDYEDSIIQRQLDTKLMSHTTETAAELHFIQELLRTMDEREKRDKNEESTVHKAWRGYELLVPCLARNADIRDWMRTSGELGVLTQRLLTVFTSPSLETLVDAWTTRANQHDTTTDSFHVDELVLTAMVSVVAECLVTSPRNQIVLYRDVAFRTMILKLLTTSHGVHLAVLPPGLRAKVLHVVEEAIESKSWKKEVISSAASVRSLLAAVSSPIDSTVPSSEIEALITAAVSASSILLTISGDDPHGLKALAAEPFCLQFIADGLQTHRRSTATLSNLLGVLTNVSTTVAGRRALDGSLDDADISALRSRLVRSLLVLASHFTKSTLPPPKRRLYQACAERALAALLNFSFLAESPVRAELVTHGVVVASHAVLGYVDVSNIEDLMLIVSRVVSLLCRLHSLQEATLHRELTSPQLLDTLYKICQLSLPSFAASSTPQASAHLWQTHAQIWCHVGWCISLSGYEAATQSYLEEKHALPAMVETLALVNGQRLYRRAASEAPTGPERIAGNVVKVLIAMLDKRETTTLWTRKANLQVLVDALQALPDGLARKNVAILLAKLCQIYGDAVKVPVRELRGIEMMLTVSKSLSTSVQASSMTQTKAVAF